MIDLYFLLKWLHILSSAVLFGTAIGSAFQMVMAMRSGRVETIHTVASAVVLADWIFTAPAGAVQLLTGLWLIQIAGLSLFEPWLIAAYALYVIAFLYWVPVIVLQIRLRDLAADALARGAPLPEAAQRLYRTWIGLGWPAFGALVVIFALMVIKPQFGF